MNRDSAQAIIVAAQGHALARDLAVTVAVVDAGVVRDGSGTVLGAVGLSGATADEDRACAEAGLAAISG